MDDSLMPKQPRPSLRRQLLRGIERTLHVSGLGSLYLRLSKAHGAVVLMYHSVPNKAQAAWIDERNTTPPDAFRAQMQFLARHRRVVSMRELVAHCQSGSAIAPGTVVITFDDGYRDNLDVAAGILDEFKLPATFYLASGYITQGEPQWIDRLFATFRARTTHELEIRGIGSGRLDLRRRSDVDLAYTDLCRRLLTAGIEARQALLASVAEQLQPSRAPERTTLNWTEVRELASNPRFEIGAHTRYHIDLRERPASEVETEVAGSLHDIGAEIGRPVEHFSYPYGRSSTVAREVVASAGLLSAVGGPAERPVGPEDDIFELPRIPAPVGLGFFRFVTSGAYPGLPKSILGRA